MLNGNVKSYFLKTTNNSEYGLETNFRNFVEKTFPVSSPAYFSKKVI